MVLSTGVSVITNKYAVADFSQAVTRGDGPLGEMWDEIPYELVLLLVDEVVELEKKLARFLP